MMFHSFPRPTLAAIAAIFFIASAIADPPVDTPDAAWRIGAQSLTGGGPVPADAIRINRGGVADEERVDSGRSDFDRAAVAIVSDRPANTWDVALQHPIQAAVKKDDWIVAHFFLRGHSREPDADTDAGAVAEFVFETAGPPHTKSVQYLAETTTADRWEEHWVRFRCLQDYEPGGAILNFQSAYQRQRIELGGLEAWTVPASVAAERLPSTAMTYPGRDRDAAWRREAEARIDQVRKTDIEWVITDDAGQPITGQGVDVELVRHAFDFGTAVSVPWIDRQDEVGLRYRETLRRHFNAVTIENALKWRQWDAGDDQHRRDAIAAMDWLRDAGLTTRGHVLVWPGKRYLPDAVIASYDRPAVLKPLIATHIRELAYATAGKVRDWDVLNEVFDNPDLTDILGDDAMVDWFKQADALLPDIDLYYNDYAGLVRGGFPTGHKDHFEKTVRYLIDNDAPIDGIGIQSHFGTLLTPPNRLLAELDRWAALGLKVLITEFDVEVADSDLQADFTEDFLTCCFSHPAVTGVITWGFYKDGMWKPRSALFDSDWQPTAMGERWIELQSERWTTRERLTTDDRGRIRFRGFRGTYEIRTGDHTLTRRTSENQ